MFCDTSFFFACLDGRDFNHARAIEWLSRSRDRRTLFFATWDIVGETLTLLRRKSGYGPAAGFARRVLPALHLVAVDESVRNETLRVFLALSRDKKLSLCDCLSYVVLTTQLDGVPAATFDGHFRMMGLPIVE